MAEKLGSGRNGPNRAELPLFSETGRKPKRPKFNGCLMIQVYYIFKFPDDMSETMTNKCQGGDHLKKSVFLLEHRDLSREIWEF